MRDAIDFYNCLGIQEYSLLYPLSNSTEYYKISSFTGGGGGRYLLQIKESLMIQKWNPELNGSVPIHLF